MYRYREESISIMAQQTRALRSAAVMMVDRLEPSIESVVMCSSFFIFFCFLRLHLPSLACALPCLSLYLLSQILPLYILYARCLSLSLSKYTLEWLFHIYPLWLANSVVSLRINDVGFSVFRNRRAPSLLFADKDGRKMMNQQQSYRWVISKLHLSTHIYIYIDKSLHTRFFFKIQRKGSFENVIGYMPIMEAVRPFLSRALCYGFANTVRWVLHQSVEQLWAGNERSDVVRIRP